MKDRVGDFQENSGGRDQECQPGRDCDWRIEEALQVGDAAGKTSESAMELKRAFKVWLKKELKNGAGSMTSGKDVAGLEMEELKAQLEEWARADPKEAPEFTRRKQWDQSEFDFDIPVCDCKNMPELKETKRNLVED